METALPFYLLRCDSATGASGERMTS